MTGACPHSAIIVIDLQHCFDYGFHCHTSASPSFPLVILQDCLSVRMRSESIVICSIQRILKVKGSSDIGKVLVKHSKWQFQELMVIIYDFFPPSRCFNVATGFELAEQLGRGTLLGGNLKIHTWVATDKTSFFSGIRPFTRWGPGLRDPHKGLPSYLHWSETTK